MIELVVNAKPVSVDVEDDTPLLWVLRENLKLPGTKFGCGIGACGACTVHVDGVAVRACQAAAGGLRGRAITTIEGIGASGLHVVQQAWIEGNVPQCGYCQSGQVMAAVALLARNARPTDADIDAAMRGNLCRCGTYGRIRAGIHRASALMAAAGSAGSAPASPGGVAVRPFDPDALTVPDAAAPAAGAVP